MEANLNANEQEQNNPMPQVKAAQPAPQPVQPKPAVSAEEPEQTVSLEKSGKPISIDSLMNVKMALVVEVGRAKLSLKELLEIQNGSVIELDRTAGDVVDILVNDHLIARGEVVLVDDKFGVRITQIIDAEVSLQNAQAS